MSEELVRILQTSENPKELVQAAVSLSGSDQPADHQALLKSLTTPAFLLRLNAQDEYAGAPRRLRVRRILEALQKNKAAPARDTLLGLVKSPVFTQEGSRVDLLLVASAGIRPPPAELVTFWDRYSQPDDHFSNFAIDAMIENDTRPSIELFEKKMADPRHEDADKIDWLRAPVLTHRNSANLLHGCGHLLRGGMPERLRGELVDVLFDYKPATWYNPQVKYKPPPVSTYSASSRAALREIGRYVLEQLKPGEGQKRAVERMLKQLEAPTSGPAN